MAECQIMQGYVIGFELLFQVQEIPMENFEKKKKMR